MSYTPTEWSSGDVITAEKLNKLETGVESNSNGYEIVQTATILTEETMDMVEEEGYIVTTLDYQTQITADEIVVVFDGVEYVCEKTTSEDQSLYGGATDHDPDFTDYPFALYSYEGGTDLLVSEEGEHTITIKIVNETMSTTSSFNDAVSAALLSGGANNALIASQVYVDDTTVLDKTWKEIYDAFMNGVAVRVACTDFDQNGEYGAVLHVNGDSYGHQYTVTFFNPSEELHFTQVSCHSENDYPAFS